MASSLRNLLKPSQVTRVIVSLRNPQNPNIAAPLVLLQTHPVDPKAGYDSSNLVPSTILGLRNAESLIDPRSSLFYPTFPFGFGLNPISSIGSFRAEPEDDGFGDSGTMWAESVKKKRKKKMNKHKLKKLRKIVRGQS